MHLHSQVLQIQQLLFQEQREREKDEERQRDWSLGFHTVEWHSHNISHQNRALTVRLGGPILYQLLPLRI